MLAGLYHKDVMNFNEVHFMSSLPFEYKFEKKFHRHCIGLCVDIFFKLELTTNQIVHTE